MGAIAGSWYGSEGAVKGQFQHPEQPCCWEAESQFMRSVFDAGGLCCSGRILGDEVDNGGPPPCAPVSQSASVWPAENTRTPSKQHRYHALFLPHTPRFLRSTRAAPMHSLQHGAARAAMG